MNVLVIGAGTIGTTVVRECQKLERVETCFVLDHHASKTDSLEKTFDKVQVINDMDTVLGHVDLVVEAASQDAVREYGIQALEAGADLLIMSVGALADSDLQEDLKGAAKSSRIYLPSGAIVGLDGVFSASMAGIEEVTLITRKSPQALNMDVDNETVVFQGPAEEAVKKFPKNINVAAALSLASAGFKNTEVCIICDPGVDRNIHEVHFKGPAGELVCVSKNLPSPDNPGTSYLACLSAASAVRKICSNLWVGL